MKPFQAVLLVVFGILALGAVFIFASFTGRGNTSVGTVTIWGTLPKNDVYDVINAVQEETHSLDRVSYIHFPEAGFTDKLVQAIAAGTGPDLVVFSSDRILSDSNKITPISFKTVTRRTFQDTYIQAGESFLTPSGTLGIPFLVDPLVMYWNRTLYSTAGVSLPPTYWDQVPDLAAHLTQKTEAGTITQSTVALGSWGNIVYAKEVLVSLVAGFGNPIVTRDDTGAVSIALSDAEGATVSPAEQALSFYTKFADPADKVFSWSPSRPTDRDAFLAGTLATYFGPASDAGALRAANPNLNFDAAAYPLVRNGVVAVPAHLYALAIPHGAHNPAGAARAALLMTDATGAKALMTATGLPSVRRDILSNAPQNAYDVIFQKAALNAFVFLDPNPTGSSKALQRMVEDVTSGRSDLTAAIHSADDALKALLK